MSNERQPSSRPRCIDPPALVTDVRGGVWPPDAEFWARFEALTEGGRKPHLFRGLLPATFPGPAEIDEVLRREHAEPEPRRRMRLYVGAALRPDLARAFHDAPLPAGVAPFAAMQQATGVERIGFVINEMQTWSEALLRATGTFLESMYAVRGMPPGGAECVLFAGNYAGTAFGAHRGYEHAFLLHLGPNDKLFHLWPDERYFELTGGRADLPDYEPLLPEADTVTLRPGDALYLPALCFHIGTQDTYSASVAVSLYDYAPEVWLAKQLGTLSSALTQGAFLIDRPGGPGHPERASRYLPAATDDDPFTALVGRAVDTLATRLVPALSRAHWYGRRSNAGFGPGPEPGPPLDVGPDSTVRLLPPFRCCLSRHEAPGRCAVYLRGQRVELREHPSLPALLQRLNAHAAVTVPEAAALLDGDWSDEAMAGFFHALSRSGGLERVA